MFLHLLNPKKMYLTFGARDTNLICQNIIIVHDSYCLRTENGKLGSRGLVYLILFKCHTIPRTFPEYQSSKNLELRSGLLNVSGLDAQGFNLRKCITFVELYPR